MFFLAIFLISDVYITSKHTNVSFIFNLIVQIKKLISIFFVKKVKKLAFIANKTISTTFFSKKGWTRVREIRS